ncbi:retinol dehydrogenase 12-like protein [Zopfochytrium polystomum]|nr:retinol dehydrogenase 12-like protein [Zopfochytrium polystomum]
MRSGSPFLGSHGGLSFDWLDGRTKGARGVYAWTCYCREVNPTFVMRILVNSALAKVGLTTPASVFGMAVALAAAVAIVRMRARAAGGRCNPKDLRRDLAGKVVVITGATAGLGFQSAVQLAKQGALVICAARNSEKSRRAVAELKAALPASKRGNIVFEELDLSSLASVRAFADRYFKSGRPLHVLMNNAGIMALPQRTLSNDEGYELQMASLLGIMKKTAKENPFGPLPEQGARIINLSSAAHRWGNVDLNDFMNSKNYRPRKTYGDTKICNILFTTALARKELCGTGVTVNAVHPGIVMTELPRSMLGGFLGQNTQLHVALSEEGGTVSGAYWDNCKRAAFEDPAGQTTDAEFADKVWDLSLQLTESGEKKKL